MPSVNVDSETYFQICFITAKSLMTDKQKKEFDLIIDGKLDDHFKNEKWDIHRALLLLDL